MSCVRMLVEKFINRVPIIKEACYEAVLGGFSDGFSRLRQISLSE